MQITNPKTAQAIGFIDIDPSIDLLSSADAHGHTLEELLFPETMPTVWRRRLGTTGQLSPVPVTPTATAAARPRL